jgi:peroxiredoxin family protein
MNADEVRLALVVASTVTAIGVLIHLTFYGEHSKSRRKN